MAFVIGQRVRFIDPSYPSMCGRQGVITGFYNSQLLVLFDGEPRTTGWLPHLFCAIDDKDWQDQENRRKHAEKYL